MGRPVFVSESEGYVTSVVKTTAALMLLAGSVAPAAPKTHSLDLAASEVVVFVYKAGLASGLAHDHVIAAKDFAGTLTYDPEHPEATRVSVTVQAASLVADLPELMKKHEKAFSEIY